ncbi:hypothetical protein GWK47_049004 [Chionoecetes opilio]|uniref:Uncharacterized protein n=1 Tax=Chionoecetes opilio TaxID=41210 RepID=A0A8J4Y9P8_CHIOP|nr:hypothetical protein GWK47_049004 [Chionoecetes opilio]
MELPAEERPLLREARNVRNNHYATPASSSAGDVGEGARLVNGTSRNPVPSGDQLYAIGDRKVFGVAQVVMTVPAQDKAPSTEVGLGVGGGTEGPPPAPPTSSIPSQEPPTPEGELPTDPQDKRIKKPPPYHIAAVMSRHAAEFGEAGMEAAVSIPQQVCVCGV